MANIKQANTINDHKNQPYGFYYISLKIPSVCRSQNHTHKCLRFHHRLQHHLALKSDRYHNHPSQMFLSNTQTDQTPTKKEVFQYRNI